MIEKENDIPIQQKVDYYFVRFSESLKIKIIYTGKLKGKPYLSGSGVSLFIKENGWFGAHTHAQYFEISVTINKRFLGKWKFRKY